jgi:hypothetical protein
LEKGRHLGIVGRLQLDLIERRCVAREDSAVGVAKSRKTVLLLHILRTPGWADFIANLF